MNKMGKVALLSHFHLQHQFGCAKPYASFNVDVKVNLKATTAGNNETIWWEQKAFFIEGLARSILHFCNGVCLTRTTLRNGMTYWSDHFNPKTHPVNASVQFVYIVYGRILNRDGEPHIFGGDYKVVSTQEVHFEEGPWLKVVCICRATTVLGRPERH